MLSARPSTKNDFSELSKNIYTSIVKKHESNPLYAHFVEQLVKDISTALTAVQTRKVSSALSVLGNTKQQEERDKASGKKKVSSSCYGTNLTWLTRKRLRLSPSSALPRCSPRWTLRLTTMFLEMTISCKGDDSVVVHTIYRSVLQ